jgi:hypothetical protein
MSNREFQDFFRMLVTWFSVGICQFSASFGKDSVKTSVL